MSRIRYIMEAPFGLDETAIEGGQPYFPDENGRAECYSEAHKAILIQHGWTEIGQESVTRPSTQRRAPIDVDDLGRTALIAALADRGVILPETTGRDAAAAEAMKWNNAMATVRVAPTIAPPASAAVTPPTSAPAPQPPPVADGDKIADPEAGFDLSAMGWQDKKGYLAARGVPVGPRATRAEVDALCVDTHEAILAKRHPVAA